MNRLPSEDKYTIMNTSLVNSTSSAAVSYEINSIYNFNFEVPYLVFVILIGITGNLIIIATALTEKKLKNMGVAFIINLAVADLAITAWHLPLVLANILNGYRNVLENHMWLCSMTAVMASLCCEVSMSTLMLISIYRYCQVTRPIKSAKYFTNKYKAMMIALIWVYCVLIALPMMTGWFGGPPLVHFDVNIQACMWDDRGAFGYNILVVIAAIFLQIVITAYMYGSIFLHVRNTSKAVKSNVGTSQRLQRITAISTENLTLTDCSTTTIPNRYTVFNKKPKGKTPDRERNLFVTLVVVVVFFILFWTPYALMTLIRPLKTPFFIRFSGWLALTNSAINSIIYGLFNRNFRHGYMNILRRLGKPFVSCFYCLKSRPR